MTGPDLAARPPATTWRAHLAARGLAAPADPGGRVVVVSSHPDDDVIAVGGWLAAQVGRPLTFVVATDGEASHPDSPTVVPQEMARLRRAELLDAYRALGHDEPHVAFLGLPDASLPTAAATLHQRLVGLLADARLVLTPHDDDGHGDHDVTGRVALAAAPADAVVWRYPIWRWEWTSPGDGDAWLSTAAALPGLTGVAGDDVRERKAAALDCFTTQVRPLSPDPADAAIVTPGVLAHALEAPEVVLT